MEKGTTIQDVNTIFEYVSSSIKVLQMPIKNSPVATPEAKSAQDVQIYMVQ